MVGLVGYVGLDFDGLFDRSRRDTASRCFTYPAIKPAHGYLVIRDDGTWSVRYTLEALCREAEGNGAASLEIFLRDIRDTLEMTREGK